MKQAKKYVYEVAGYEIIIPVRFTFEQFKMIKKIMRESEKKDGLATYDTISEFIRGSAVKRIREERTRLKI